MQARDLFPPWCWHGQGPEWPFASLKGVHLGHVALLWSGRIEALQISLIDMAGASWAKP